MGTAKKGSPSACGNGAAPKRREFPAGTLAIAVAASQNSKIGDAATTYVEQRSCPSSCVFFDGGGCYAEQGTVGMFMTAPLNRAAAMVEASPEEIAEAEAAQIDSLVVKPGRPLRLHTVGDCKTDAAAQSVAAAAARYVARGGGPVWTYTHAWRDVARDSWGDVHILASCEKAEHVAAAHARGYATSMVVTEFATRGLYDLDGASVVPCPAQTKKGVTCTSCRLCMDTPRLREKQLTIGFENHGTELGKRRTRLALDDPDKPDRKLSSRVLIPRFIKNFVDEHGREPSTREIANALAISPSSVQQMRKKLAGEARGVAG
jgi:hypothetical protein